MIRDKIEAAATAAIVIRAIVKRLGPSQREAAVQILMGGWLDEVDADHRGPCRRGLEEVCDFYDRKIEVDDG